MRRDGERTGVLGGTFDPIHVGHIAAAEAAIKCARLDRVILIPAGQPPHRPAAAASPQQRLEMSRLAAAGDERFAVIDLELRRPGPSYTLDTLLELRSLHPRDELFLILGWDAASLFQSWHQPDQVRAMASIVIIARPGRQSPRQADLEAAGLAGENVMLCLEHTPAVSASDVRRAVSAAESIAGKVPTAVEQYIEQHRLYSSERG